MKKTNVKTNVVQSRINDVRKFIKDMTADELAETKARMKGHCVSCQKVIDIKNNGVYNYIVRGNYCAKCNNKVAEKVRICKSDEKNAEEFMSLIFSNCLN